MKMEQSVPKRRHMKFRRRGITQKKAYNIQDTAKDWNQEKNVCIYVYPYMYIITKLQRTFRCSTPVNAVFITKSFWSVNLVADQNLPYFQSLLFSQPSQQ